MRRLESLRADAGVLARLLRGMPDGDLGARLATFYGPQAEHYDRFRDRLLHGRAELIGALDLPRGARVVELGGGTGRNLEFFPRERREDLRFELVDLCAPLLEIARRRTRGWPHVRIIEGDATRWRPDAPVDCVLLSYALTMIPDWRAAIDNAVAMLAPGGVLAAVDFHAGAMRPAPGRLHQGHVSRAFWRRWFAHDGVHLDAAHLDHLIARLPRHALVEARAPLPYVPWLRVPYYRFVGRLPARAAV
ncbi:class I SAM-dependent methyltransferase [Chiayiivirga flava]|uniref:Ubiquinone/menaquinone biosynthesis C-methylase UbiE n=1 Tax=Chiayiivirga flava TaxID=659595 RepID=A0A7W8DBJ6_9GAMM|nr:class I SAM-dependent methyltransferase [Chiayiivirga flava]MBB5209688.1 ubiquinone/menaquinone biosynthesis C-methylase UbiE [Chiayiivirga flava]